MLLIYIFFSLNPFNPVHNSLDSNYVSEPKKTINETWIKKKKQTNLTSWIFDMNENLIQLFQEKWQWYFDIRQNFTNIFKMQKLIN